MISYNSYIGNKYEAHGKTDSTPQTLSGLADFTKTNVLGIHSPEGSSSKCLWQFINNLFIMGN